MLRIDVEQQAVADRQHLRRLRARRGEAQHRVRAVAVLVDQVFAHLRRTRRLRRADDEPRQRIRRDLPMPRADLAPRDRAVLVDIETDGDVEVAQRDVPLPLHRCAVDGERQVAVGRLVRERAAGGEDACEGKQAKPTETHRPLPAPAPTSAATLGYSSRVFSSHARTTAFASASPVAAAASASTRRSAGSRCTAQFSRASTSARAGSASRWSANRASSRRCTVSPRSRLAAKRARSVAMLAARFGPVQRLSARARSAAAAHRRAHRAP